MKASPEVLDILFPKVRAEVLRLLFSDPTQQRYVRELMARSGLALRTVQEELGNLNAAGLVTSWSNDTTAFIGPIAITRCSRISSGSFKQARAFLA